MWTLQKRVRSVSVMSIVVLLAGMVAMTIPASAAVAVEVFAGSGTNGPLVNDIPATTASFSGLSGVAVASDGTVYFADKNHNQIRKIGADGIVRAALGTGAPSCAIGGANTTVYQPRGVTVDLAGNLYVSACNSVYRMAPDGSVSLFAGRETGNYVIDIPAGMPATEASLSNPTGMDYDEASGALYIADQGSFRILKVVGGTISIVAGTYYNGYTGDGVPATSTRLNYPSSVVYNDGTLYIADSSNCRVRAVGSDGIIQTIVGTGSCYDYGDNIPGDTAPISVPGFMTWGLDNKLYIAGSISGAIRAYNPVNHNIEAASELYAGTAGLDFMPGGELIAAGGTQQLYKITGLFTPPPIPDGKQHGKVTGVNWTVTPQTALWNIDVTVNTSNVSCQTGATLVISASTWVKRPKLCAAGETAPSEFHFNWKVFNKNQSLAPGSSVAISAYIAKSDAIRYGGPSTQLTVPSQPTLIGVGDSYLSGHRQLGDQPLCTTPQGSSPCAPADFQPNDPAFSWVTRLADKLNTNVPEQWQFEYDASHLLARSGATTQQMVDSQSYDMISLLQGHSQSWNVVTLSGGANDADFARSLYDFYQAHNHTILLPLAPWAVKKWVDCPDTESIYNRSAAQQATITANLREIMQRARDGSNGAVRFVDMLYPYALKADNVCNVDTPLINPSDPSSSLTWHGAKAVVDRLNTMHTGVDADYTDVAILDLRTEFSNNPLSKTQQTRNYGYPHPNDSGQDKIAKTAAQLLKQ